MAARRKPSAAETPSEPGFEEALAELETLVEAMEEEQLPLEDLVAHYEQGSALLRRCESVLKSARERLELITLRNQTENDLDSATTPMHGGTPPPETPEDDLDDDDDIRLF